MSLEIVGVTQVVNCVSIGLVPSTYKKIRDGCNHHVRGKRGIVGGCLNMFIATLGVVFIYLRSWPRSLGSRVYFNDLLFISFRWLIYETIECDTDPLISAATYNGLTIVCVCALDIPLKTRMMNTSPKVIS